MNNVGNTGLQPNNTKEPVPVETGPDKAVPQNKPVAGPAPVSRAPLNLGGTGAPASAPAAGSAAPAATPPRPAAPKPAPVRPAIPVAAGVNERITGCKTFFTKLHPGAIDFLDEQITQWLKDNPGVFIKATNTTTGEVQGKKTEANILLTVWYYGQATTKAAAHMG